jgi:fatty-acid desaturase
MERDTNSSLLKWSRRHLGMALVFAGALLLIVSLLVGWSSSNTVLVISLLMIILGIVVDVKQTKRRGKY